MHAKRTAAKKIKNLGAPKIKLRYPSKYADKKDSPTIMNKARILHLAFFNFCILVSSWTKRRIFFLVLFFVTFSMGGKKLIDEPFN